MLCCRGDLGYGSLQPRQTGQLPPRSHRRAEVIGPRNAREARGTAPLSNENLAARARPRTPPAATGAEAAAGWGPKLAVATAPLSQSGMGGDERAAARTAWAPRAQGRGERSTGAPSWGCSATKGPHAGSGALEVPSVWVACAGGTCVPPAAGGHVLPLCAVIVTPTSPFPSRPFLPSPLHLPTDAPAACPRGAPPRGWRLWLSAARWPRRPPPRGGRPAARGGAASAAAPRRAAARAPGGGRRRWRWRTRPSGGGGGRRAPRASPGRPPPPTATRSTG